VKRSLSKAVTVSEDATEKEDTFRDSVDVDQGWVVVETGGTMVCHRDYWHLILKTVRFLIDLGGLKAHVGLMVIIDLLEQDLMGQEVIGLT